MFRASKDQHRALCLLQNGEQQGKDLVYEQAARRVQAIHQDTRDDAGASIYEMKERILEQQYQHQLEKREQRVEQEERRLEHKRRVTLAELEAAKELQRNGAKRQKTMTEKLLVHSIDQLQEMFLHALSQKRNENGIPEHLRTDDDEIRTSGMRKILTAWLYKVDQGIMNNTKSGARWVLPILLPDPSKPVRGDGKNPISKNVRRQQQVPPRNLQQAMQARIDPHEIMRNQMFFD